MISTTLKLLKENNLGKVGVEGKRIILLHSQHISPQGGSVWQLVSQRHALEDKFPSKVSSCLDNLQFSPILWEESANISTWMVKTDNLTAYPLLCWNSSTNKMKLKLGFKEKQGTYGTSVKAAW